MSQPTASQSSPSLNRLLAALPGDVFQRLWPHLEEVELSFLDILYCPGREITRIYFPEDALVSIVSGSSDRPHCEIGMVGIEGVVGIPAFLAGISTAQTAIVQISGRARAIDTAIALSEFDRGEAFQKQILHFIQAFLTQVSYTAVSNAINPVDKRLARWLLLAQDCLDTNEIYITQEFMAIVLSVRRASISEAASPLKDVGIIDYSRGRITIFDRPALEAIAGDCYRKVRQEYDVLLGNLNERI